MILARFSSLAHVLAELPTVLHHLGCIQRLSSAAVQKGRGALTPRGRDEGRGIQAYVDGSPSKGRVRKALRPQGAATTPMTGNPLYGQRKDGVYESIVDKASKLFVVIRQSVVCDLAPSALKSSFLDPLHSSLFSEVRTRQPSVAWGSSAVASFASRRVGLRRLENHAWLITAVYDFTYVCRSSCRCSRVATSTL
jgi:hypothetical protein